MTAIPREAAIGFDRGAADYERGRPEYPATVATLLDEQLGIGPGRLVVDLAAGTGKLTRALLGTGATIVAVEPVAGMRAQLERAVPGVEVMDGTAERMPFADGAVDVVAVAQAFHWFDIPVAAAEIHRVLVRGGGLAIVRNEWDESVEWVAALRRLVGERTGHHPRNRLHFWRAPLEATGLFTPLAERVLPNPVQVDMDTLMSRISSLSYVAMMDEAERDQVLAAVRELVHTHGAVDEGGVIETPYRTHVLWASAIDR